MAATSTRQLLRFRNNLSSHSISTIGSVNPNSHSSSFSVFTSVSTSGIGSPVTRTLSVFKSFQILLQSSCQSTRQLLQIQAHLITSSLLHNPFLSRTLLRRASVFCDIDYTVLIFLYIDSLDNFCVNTVLEAYCNSHVPHQGVVFYFQSLRNRFFPNSYTFVPLISSCAKMGCLKSGRKCHGQAFKNGVDSVLPVQNSLIHMYGCCGGIDVAKEVFDNMSIRDLVSWNSIIHGCITFGDLSVAHKLFDEMPERNVVSWNVMINGFLKAGNPGYALKLFREMVKTGLKGNVRTLASVLSACGRSARLREGRSVHGNMVRMFISSSLILNTALLDMYCKCQRVDVADRVFERMTDRNLVSWNAMILGHCIHGNPEVGLDLFDTMVEMTKTKHEVEPDESSKADRGQEALHPDEITFIGVLCACARAELLTKGRSYFKQMTDIFGVKPNFAHFWCMANLLASVGLIEKAEKFLRRMPEFDGNMSSESLLWANLLSSCRFKKDVSMGEQIAKALIDMEPKNLGCYVFLLNIYAAAGQWENVWRVIKLINKRRLWRIPGCSLVDLKYIVHEFKVSSNNQEGIEAINNMMDEITHRLRLCSDSERSPVDQNESTS